MENKRSNGAVSSGVGFGVVLAVVISYTANESVWWAMWHGFLGWFYVIYRMIVGMP